MFSGRDNFLSLASFADEDAQLVNRFFFSNWEHFNPCKMSCFINLLHSYHHGHYLRLSIEVGAVDFLIDERHASNSERLQVTYLNCISGHSWSHVIYFYLYLMTRQLCKLFIDCIRCKWCENFHRHAVAIAINSQVTVATRRSETSHRGSYDI